MLLAVAPVIHAQSAAAGPLTLDECIALAVRQSESLQAQSVRKAEAGQRLVQARGGLLPSITFTYSQYLRDRAGGTIAGDGLNKYFEAVQPVFYGFRKANATAAARVARLREELQYRSLRRQINAEVATVYYTVAAIASDLRNVRDTMQLMRDRVKELDGRVRLGKSRESEVLTVESQLAALKAQAEKLEGDRLKAMETLALLTGVPSASITITTAVQPVTAVEPLDAALAAGKTRSDIAAVHQDIAVQEYQVRIARGALWPSAYLDGLWYTARNGSYAHASWDLYLVMDMPLFQGGALRAQVKEEALRLQEAHANASLLERQVETELRQLHHALVSSRAQSVAYREAYEKAERSYQLQMKEYRLGLVTNLDVLEAMMSLRDEKSSYDRSLIQVVLDQVMLDIATERIK